MVWGKRFTRRNWLGTAVILAATLLFFTPTLLRLDSYSPGGDAMFNAWEIGRNQHCILGQGCPDYTDANIFFPHKDTMLYSESQLTPALLTLPLRLITENPIFAYNVWTIACFFFSGWFMYLLAMRISKGNKFIAILAGLIFAFAPFKISAIFHMQNISIFFLPLAVLITLKFFERKNKWWLLALFAAMTLQFYASWVQMVFVLTVFGLLLLGMGIFKLEKWKTVMMVGIAIVAAVLTTLPLAKEYMRFARENNAAFPIAEQLLYQSSLVDYVTPQTGTLLGNAYAELRPGAHGNAWNLDSASYHGFVLYAVGIVVLLLAFIRRKKSHEERRNYRVIITLWVIGLVGFIFSLGPLLKIKGEYVYATIANNLGLVIPMPYALVDLLVPQLAFIRAVGRWSILFLFALCCLLAFLPFYLRKFDWLAARKRLIYAGVGLLVLVELMPIHMIPMSKYDFSYNLQVPAVFRYVKDRPEINDMVIIAGDGDYPGAEIPTLQPEWVMWSGYHNRNIFNGYSGYIPPEWLGQYIDFKDLDRQDLDDFRQLGIKYVIIDKQVSLSKPELIVNAKMLLPEKLYEDERHALFKVPR